MPLRERASEGKKRVKKDKNQEYRYMYVEKERKGKRGHGIES